METKMMIMVIAIFIAIFIVYIMSMFFFLKAVEKDNKKTMEEATKWYESLSESERAHIMDVIWKKCPSNFGAPYLISIYEFYNKKNNEKERK